MSLILDFLRFHCAPIAGVDLFRSFAEAFFQKYPKEVLKVHRFTKDLQRTLILSFFGWHLAHGFRAMECVKRPQDVGTDWKHWVMFEVRMPV